MPKREVTSALWVPVPARACTGKVPRARQHRAVGRLSAGAPRLHKSCRWRRPQSKGRSCVSGRARRDLRVRAVEAYTFYKTIRYKDAYCALGILRDTAFLIFYLFVYFRVPYYTK